MTVTVEQAMRIATAAANAAADAVIGFTPPSEGEMAGWHPEYARAMAADGWHDAKMTAALRAADAAARAALDEMGVRLPA